MNYRRFPSMLLLSLFASAALAHGDEDHGAAQMVMPVGAGWPSAEAHSEDFELFAQLQGERLTVYLDQYADNQPVANASIELASGAFSVQLEAVSPGQYAADAPPLAHPGEHELSFTLRAGEQFDLLETRLKVSPPATAQPPMVGVAWRWLAGALSGAVLLGLLLAGRARQRQNSRPAPQGPAL
jgi:hypothetical protein